MDRLYGPTKGPVAWQQVMSSACLGYSNFPEVLPYKFSTPTRGTGRFVPWSCCFATGLDLRSKMGAFQIRRKGLRHFFGTNDKLPNKIKQENGRHMASFDNRRSGWKRTAYIFYRRGYVPSREQIVQKYSTHRIIM